MLHREAFEQLYKDHYKGLFFFALQYVKNDEAAREIVQNAFINLWEKRDNIDLSRQVKSYLSTTVRNRCLNHLRDNRKFDKELLDLEQLSPDSLYEQSDRLVEAELRDAIHKAMNDLPEKCREVFRLNRFEQMKYQEIADQLRISVKTVETQMSKALQHMREKLKEFLVPVILFMLLPSVTIFLSFFLILVSG